MKNVLTGVTLFIFTAISTSGSIAQSSELLSQGQTEFTSSNKVTKNENERELKKEDGSATLAVNVFQTFDDKMAISVRLKNYAKGSVTIKLKSSAAILHKEIVLEASYGRKYNMYSLPVGDYIIEIANDQQTFTENHNK